MNKNKIKNIIKLNNNKNIKNKNKNDINHIIY